MNGGGSIMKKLLPLLFAIVFLGGIPAAHAQKSGSCDRACLEGIADQYLAAMVAHDASKASFARNFIFTENTIKLPYGIGDGWSSSQFK